MRGKNGGSRIENVEWREICLKCNLLLCNRGRPTKFEHPRTIPSGCKVDVTPNYNIVGGE